MGGYLRVWLRGICGGDGGLRMGGGKEGVTNVTEVGVLNCDLGFAVSGIKGDVVCAFGSSREVLSQKSPCLRGFVVTAWVVTYVCEGDVRYESYEYVERA